ncbi:MAG: hypothetical protein PHF11_08085, partial [Candidatus Omnitrophica bacterium]|nr:hypothetical protein [Candidatus Omnitrophota bacterium]
PQAVDVREGSIKEGEKDLKNITLLPELPFVSAGKGLSMKAFATYFNNKVEEITGQADWEIADEDILSTQGEGVFLASSTGVTEVTAGMKGRRSVPSKVIVAARVNAVALSAPQQQKTESPGKIKKDIRREVENLKKRMSRENRNLHFLNIVPDNITIPAGQNTHLKAIGLYDDNSDEDLTDLAQWSGTDENIIRVEAAGKIEALKEGESNVYASFKGIKSFPAAVKVTPPDLVSIILAPENMSLTMGKNSVFKAEGLLTDSSRIDITSSVKWLLDKPRLVKIDKGKVQPLRLGRASVIAEYSGLKSLPARVEVLFTWGYLALQAFKTLFIIFVLTVIGFAALFFITENKKNALKSKIE